MATSAPQPVINTESDINGQISIAKQDGGIAVFQTTKDIYVTDVDETVVYQSVKNVTNSPSGNLNGEVQFLQSGKFNSDSSFKYDSDNATLNVTKIQVTGANLGQVGSLTILGGSTGQILSTDGLGNLSWIDDGGNGGTGSYTNSNVAAYLPVYGGNILVNSMTAASANLVSIRVSGSANFTSLQASGNVVATRFTGDGGGLSNIQLANIDGDIGNANVAGPNTSIQFNEDGILKGVTGFTIDSVTNRMTVANLVVSGTIVGSGNNLSNIQGANVSGAVPFAAIANSVAGANVSGQVGFAAVANSVAGANVTGTVASATVAASANSVAGANVTGVVANAAHAVTSTSANSVAGANVTGVVANAAHAVLATNAETVDGGNVYGEVSFAAISNSVAGANVTGAVANAVYSTTSGSTGFVTNSTQSNITQVGTLTSLNSTGDITGAGIISTGGIQAVGNATVGNIAANNAVFTGTGSFGGALSMGSFNISNLAEPVLDGDAATKFYVDTLASTGISYHTAVQAATTTTLAVASGGTITYNNGTAGVGATLTTTGTFTLIDGVNITTPGTRVLIKNESNAAHNGVYVFTNSTTLTRSSDTDSYGPTDNTVLRENAYFFVSGGSTNVGTAFVCSTSGVIVFGTTSILFSQFSTSQVYSAGVGITLLNTTFSINPSQPTVTSVGTLTSLSVTGNVTAGNTQISGTSTTTGNVVGGNLRTGGAVVATGGITGGSFTTAGTVTATGNVVGGNLRTGGTLSVTGNTTLVNASVTGAFTVGNISASNLSLSGTLSVTGNANVGNLGAIGGVFNTVSGSLTTAAQPAITSVGTLSSLSVSGNVNASNLAIGGQITTPNITVTNRAVLGDVGNVRITGGTSTSFLKTDGLGGLSWADPLPQIGPDVTSNLDFYPLFALANTGPLAEVYTSASNFKFNPVTGTLSTGGLEMSNIQANVGNITVVNASTLNGSAVNGSTITGTNVVTPTLTARTSAIEIKSLGTGDIKFTTASGNVTMTSPTLFKNLLDPDQPQDAATKHYTDAVAQGLDPMVNALAATTGTLASITGGSVTYDNGVDGVGATLTLTSALTTVDGVTLSNGNRILVHLEADETHNGVYVLTSSTVLTRATDNDDASKLLDGSFVFIAAGTIFGKIGFVQINTITTVGVDPVKWVQFAAAPNYVSGAGIYINGAEIKIDNTGVTAGSYGGGGSIPVLNINSRGQIISASTSGISAPAGGLTGTTIHPNVAFSNLQSVGTLVDLTVGGPVTIAGDTLMLGSVTAANASLGNLVTANFFQGDGGLLSNIQVDLTDLTNGTSTVVVDPSASVRTIIAGSQISEVTTTGINVTGEVEADTVVATTSMTAPDFIGRAQTANVATMALSATVAETVSLADQPTITSLGTLTSLEVSGTTNLGAVGNVTLTGGLNGQFLRTNGAGVLSWAPVTVSTVTTNAQPNITSVGTLTSLAVSGGVTAQSFTGAHIGDGGNLSNVQASNITGAIAFATIANSVAGANVTGAVALSTTTNSVDGANVFGAVSLAQVAYSVDGANVIGTVSLSLESYSVAGANVTGSVAFASIANSVTGSNVSGQVANALVATTVTAAAQPNITSVGTLTQLTVDGVTQLGAVANVKISGGTGGQVLTSDGSGGVTWNTLPIVAGFPTLPQYPDDATATSAAGTPVVGMMYYDTTLEAVKVYKTAGWASI